MAAIHTIQELGIDTAGDLEVTASMSVSIWNRVVDVLAMRPQLLEVVNRLVVERREQIAVEDDDIQRVGAYV